MVPGFDVAVADATILAQSGGSRQCALVKVLTAIVEV